MGSIVQMHLLRPESQAVITSQPRNRRSLFQSQRPKACQEFHGLKTLAFNPKWFFASRNGMPILHPTRLGAEQCAAVTPVLLRASQRKPSRGSVALTGL
uniref:Uncharacterized protein n=1 Tax=Sphaerodactylus townsendi TaxID=933632 RepID=A0ACB8EY92_9SAUR